MKLGCIAYHKDDVDVTSLGGGATVMETSMSPSTSSALEALGDAAEADAPDGEGGDEAAGVFRFSGGEDDASDELTEAVAVR
jgi:hypothetical protein